jgi:hypothetical protein
MSRCGGASSGRPCATGGANQPTCPSDPIEHGTLSKKSVGISGLPNLRASRWGVNPLAIIWAGKDFMERRRDPAADGRPATAPFACRVQPASAPPQKRRVIALHPAAFVRNTQPASAPQVSEGRLTCPPMLVRCAARFSARTEREGLTCPPTRVRCAARFSARTEREGLTCPPTRVRCAARFSGLARRVIRPALQGWSAKREKYRARFSGLLDNGFSPRYSSPIASRRACTRPLAWCCGCF